MLQIKTISEWQWADEFQEKVNNWINDRPECEIVDIKYSTVFHEDIRKILFSAIIIYNYKGIFSSDS